MTMRYRGTENDRKNWFIYTLGITKRDEKPSCQDSYLAKYKSKVLQIHVFLTLASHLVYETIFGWWVGLLQCCRENSKQEEGKLYLSQKRK